MGIKDLWPFRPNVTSEEIYAQIDEILCRIRIEHGYEILKHIDGFRYHKHTVMPSYHEMIVVVMPQIYHLVRLVLEDASWQDGRVAERYGIKVVNKRFKLTVTINGKQV